MTPGEAAGYVTGAVLIFVGLGFLVRFIAGKLGAKDRSIAVILVLSAWAAVYYFPEIEDPTAPVLPAVSGDTPATHPACQARDDILGEIEQGRVQLEELNARFDRETSARDIVTVGRVEQFMLADRVAWDAGCTECADLTRFREAWDVLLETVGGSFEGVSYRDLERMGGPALDIMRREMVAVARACAGDRLEVGVEDDPGS
ncbi:MAG: hypothetical protein OXI39_15210 [Gemmatimonadota bacterium]|uniref:hypothetical protein n=1 Tax=Candidatus Palauibacter scopulicola TaxID=3056741 RepID=UPI0023953CC9|nr:hypothetical protein [Candidatus Palauibacter scopulicola]MDE2664334.1 hypothetical protein [Candidatus Palauibacter scopulicola]